MCLVASCSGSQPPRFASVSAFDPEAPRRPAAVAVDPSAPLPSAAAREHTQHGVIVLEPPADLRRAREVVRAFFRAVVAEDIVQLEAVVPESAFIQLDSGSGRRKAREFWRTRMTQLAYDQLPAAGIYRDSDVEWYRSDDVARLRRTGLPSLQTSPGDVVLKVPILTPSLNKDRLFGDDIVFVLRPSGKSFQIAEMLEPFQLN